MIEWNQALLQAVRNAKMGPPMVARALAIAHTCMYDAWTGYDRKALGVATGATLRQPSRERDASDAATAISYAAYRCAINLFPADRSTLFEPLMKQLGYDVTDALLTPLTPQGTGNLAAAAVLATRRADGSNQFGDLTAGGTAYADYTNYVPVNQPSPVPVSFTAVSDVSRWQPLQYVDASGVFVTQKYLAPFWGKVQPFALTSGSQFRTVLARFGPLQPSDPGFLAQARELVDMSANLTDQQKMIAEYWADGPQSETPPGHWNLFAQYVSARDRNSLEDDVKLFFALTNAVFDASIAAWDSKQAFDSGRPVTVIPYLFHGQTIRAWGGPGRGAVSMDGSQWTPYQAASFPTPPFPEFVSGHSTFSAAAAEILRLFTGSDRFGATVSFEPGVSKYENGFTPRTAVTLRWPTFSEAADEAGLSRRYGGIHFAAGDLAGRTLGRLIARQAWEKSRNLWSGGKDLPDQDRGR